MSRVARALFPLLWLVLGCDALQGFRTAPGEVFSGEVIGSDSQASHPSFIRQGFDSHTEMDLTFDPALAAAADNDKTKQVKLKPAGTIDTYVCPTKSDFCAASQRVPGHFRHSKLEVIPNLTHDALSQYDFPGGGRLRNYILMARFDSTAANATLPRSATVFLSLMENGGMEARVIAPSVLDTDGQTELEPALFGVFPLGRRKL
jgi:hypothetical protein